MPKIVDLQERREQIADAVFTLIERGGVEAASLRNVAAEAGLNVGSVRHYVDSHEGMLIDAVREMARRITARIETRMVTSYPGADDPAALLDYAIDLLQELLPLDDERRREVAVWLAFCERSRVTPGLQEEARALIDGSRQLARPLLSAAGVDAEDLDVACESLASVVDGLAIALLHDPDRLTRDQIRAILGVQLSTCIRGALYASGIQGEAPSRGSTYRRRGDPRQ